MVYIKSNRVLEFSKILELLEAKTLTPLGKKMALDLEPKNDLSLIVEYQKETTEARRMLEEESPPIQILQELEPTIIYADRGGVLIPQQLRELARFLKLVNQLKDYLSSFIDKSSIITEMGEELIYIQSLYREITLCIDEDGKVLDSASPKLSSIRKKIINTEENLRDTLQGIIRNPNTRKYLQDPIITTRNNRYVVPVKSEYKNYFKGIVHDRSASGATIFIEPMKTVELNNLAVSLIKEEEGEIHRILSELSDKVGKSATTLINNYNIYCHLDFIFAKGKVSKDMKGTEPVFSENRETVIIAGRHPLIKEEDVVPIDINLGQEFNTLVITGPNTGGKTVTLKTLGLFSLMAQSGLHLPAELGTKLAIFEKVFADIGDEQSIEQSLSTFSGHMENIVNIISALNHKALVLLDELGAGTDPAEGAALAMALLTYFHEQGVVTVATSHYSELKAFAYSHPAMQNASMEFDIRTLSPTYRLLMGIPGKSNALDIASRLGLSSSIISKARELQKTDDIKVDDMVADLVKKQNQATENEEKTRKVLDDARLYMERGRREAEETHSKKRDVLQKAREEALSIINRAKREAEESYQELKKIKVESMSTSSRERTLALKGKLKKSQDEIYQDQEDTTSGNKLEEKDIKPGLSVFIKSLNQQGQLLNYDPDNKEVSIQVGIMKIKTDLNDLLSNEEKNAPSETRKETVKLQRQKSNNVSPENDLRGLTLSETIDIVEKYLDDCVLAGLERITLIHGKGTGRLRQGLQIYLDNHPQVDEHRLGEQGEGDSGVTIVTLKK